MSIEVSSLLVPETRFQVRVARPCRGLPRRRAREVDVGAGHDLIAETCVELAVGRGLDVGMPGIVR